MVVMMMEWLVLNCDSWNSEPSVTKKDPPQILNLPILHVQHNPSNSLGYKRKIL